MFLPANLVVVAVRAAVGLVVAGPEVADPEVADPEVADPEVAGPEAADQAGDLLRLLCRSRP